MIILSRHLDKGRKCFTGPVIITRSGVVIRDTYSYTTMCEENNVVSMLLKDRKTNIEDAFIPSLYIHLQPIAEPLFSWWYKTIRNFSTWDSCVSSSPKLFCGHWAIVHNSLWTFENENKGSCWYIMLHAYECWGKAVHSMRLILTVCKYCCTRI